MPKIIEIDIQPFQGRVTLCQPLNLEQVIALEDAQDAATAEETPSALLTKLNEIQGVKGDDGEPVKVSWSSRQDRHFIPALCKSVEKWELTGLPEKVTPENFPMTPRGAAVKLVRLLVGELMTIYNGETEVPNAS